MKRNEKWAKNLFPYKNFQHYTGYYLHAQNYMDTKINIRF